MRRRDLLSILSIAASRARAAEPHFECIDTHTHMHRSAPVLIAALIDARDTNPVPLVVMQNWQAVLR